MGSKVLRQGSDVSDWKQAIRIPSDRFSFAQKPKENPGFTPGEIMRIVQDLLPVPFQMDRQ